MIPKNKTISILHPFINKKGWAVKMMIYLSNLLLEEWNNVVFYTFSYDKELFKWIINFEVRVWSKFKIAKAIKNSDYIIIWNSPMQFVWALSKTLFFSKAIIIWWHHHYPWYYGESANFLILMKRYVEKLSLRKIDILVANSKYLQATLDKLYKKDSKVLYPIVDDVFFENDHHKKDFKNKIIFTYSRWVKWKNINEIFDTYEYLAKKVPNLSLNIWWVWEEIDFYKEKFKTDKKISFLWLLDNESIITNFNKSLLFLFPSKIDSFWMSILEAQISSVPVIAFDLNWVKEIVINSKTGFLVKTPKEFKEKTLLLLTDSDLYNNFSIESWKLKKKFSKDNFYKQLNNIF